MWDHADWLTSKWLPGGTSILRNKDVLSVLLSNTDVDSLCWQSRLAAVLVEFNPGDTDNLSIETVFASRWVWCIGTGGGEAGDLVPGGSVIGRFPETIVSTSTQEEDAATVWINNQTLTHTTAWHVTADLEWQLGLLPCASIVNRAENGAVVWIPRDRLEFVE